MEARPPVVIHHPNGKEYVVRYGNGGVVASVLGELHETKLSADPKLKIEVPEGHKTIRYDIPPYLTEQTPLRFGYHVYRPLSTVQGKKVMRELNISRRPRR